MPFGSAISSNQDMAEAGADMFTFHIEATDDAAGLIKAIKAAGMKVGIAIKPKTPVDSVFPFVADVDLILVMTVEPGFGASFQTQHPILVWGVRGWSDGPEWLCQGWLAGDFFSGKRRESALGARLRLANGHAGCAGCACTRMRVSEPARASSAPMMRSRRHALRCRSASLVQAQHSMPTMRRKRP
jgi:hypothetical protein